MSESISKADEEEAKLRDKLQKDYRGTIGLIEKEVDKILISQKIIPDKFSIEYKDLVRRFIELKLMRKDWKKDLLNDSRKKIRIFKMKLKKNGH